MCARVPQSAHVLLAVLAPRGCCVRECAGLQGSARLAAGVYRASMMPRRFVRHMMGHAWVHGVRRRGHAVALLGRYRCGRKRRDH